MELFNLTLWPPFLKQYPNATDSIDHIVIDSRRVHSSRSLFIALPGNRTDGHHYLDAAAASGCRLCVIEDTWQGPVPASMLAIRVPSPLRALQEIAAIYRSSYPAKVIAITGSYGKTMLKDLLQDLISEEFSCVASPESFNSQIGVALSLLMIRPEHKFAIIEAGISLPGEMTHLTQMLKPDHAILTGLGKRQHLTLGGKEQTLSEMKILFDACSGWNAGPKEVAIPFTNRWNSAASPQHQDGFLCLPSGRKIALPDCDHAYYKNLVQMAASAALLCGVSEPVLEKILCRYIPQRMRTEIWQPAAGPKFINDRYCGDPLSIDQGLWQLKRHSQETGKKFFLFSGVRGQPTQQDYNRIASSIQSFGIHSLHCVGAQPLNLPMQQHPDMKSALKAILKEANSQDSVLIKGSEKIPLSTIAEVAHGSLLTSQCTINLAAIKHNIELLRRNLPPQTRMMPIVKAAAYGTQERMLARFLEECGIDILGVAHVDEGISLKRSGARQSIFCLHAAPYEAEKVVDWGLEVGVSSLDCIKTLIEAAELKNAVVKVHLHVDTGMARFGCRPEDALPLARAIHAHPNLHLEGIMTHFVAADDPSHDTFTIEQAGKLTQAIHAIEADGIPIPWRHAANSSATQRLDFPHFNMVRIGLAMYGLVRTAETRLSSQLRLALSLTTKLAGINLTHKDETVGYGRRWKSESDSRIGVIPLGYYDGLHRQYSNKAQVMIRGKKVPLVGSICMDYCMCDLSNVPEAEIGDTVLIFGEDDAGHYLAPSELANSGGTIVHELITCLGPRVHRIFIDEEKP